MKCAFSWFKYILFLSSVGFSAQAQIDSTTYTKIFPREASENYDKLKVTLSDEQIKWLKDKNKIILAVPQPDNPPMGITLRSDYYEGVTADILGIMSESMNIAFVAKKYPSRLDAVNAVKSGEADIIASANIGDVSQGLHLTPPYIADEPAIYKSTSIKYENIKSIAVVESYLPTVDILRLFPRAKLHYYKSRYEAVSAVAYGKSDAILIDMISGNYIVNNFYSDSVHLAKPIITNTGGFAFGINDNNYILSEIMTRALKSISKTHTRSIINRWSGGGLSLGASQIKLNYSELQWLREKETITIVANDNTPPMSYKDIKGNMHGLIVDLAQVISAKIDIPINVVPVSSTSTQLAMLHKKSADLMVSTLSDERISTYSTSNSFAIDPLVYVVNKKNKGMSTEVLSKYGTVALIDDFIPSKLYKEMYRPNRFLYFKKVGSALDCISSMKCDITVIPLRMAKFVINANYGETLMISDGAFNAMPISIGFAALKSQGTLIDIINKVLMTIPPDELDKLATSWRVNAKHESISVGDLISHFWHLIIASIIALLCLVFWIVFLRRLIIQKNRLSLQLKDQLNFISVLIDSTPHPIYSLDMDGRLSLCNESYASFLKKSKSELIGRNIRELSIEIPFLNLFVEFINSEEFNNLPIEGDYAINVEDVPLTIYTWVHKFSDINGVAQGLIGGWIDISERMTLLSKLDQAKNDALDANLAKSKFLATMSHEIRTPMNAIIGLLELTLLKGSLNDEDYDAISTASRTTNDLLLLIGDILDISKIESGKLELSPKNENLKVLTQSVINIFNALARQKNLILSYEIDFDIFVMIDPARYKQILSNLISNAIKFTDSGTITVSISADVKDDLCAVTLDVIDTGIGINETDITRLCQPFSQGRQPVHLTSSGTGLGLAISKTLCIMMGGDLKISSEEGKGTKVTVKLLLPLATTNTCSENIIVEKKLSLNDDGFKILILDDHSTNRKLLSEQLLFLGHQPESASSGVEGLLRLEKSSFDYIITDFNMPEMNGIEFAKNYRQYEKDAGRNYSIIIGCTADARNEQLKMATIMGMDDCLFKPINLEQLQDTINKNKLIIKNKPVEEIAEFIQDKMITMLPNRPELIHSLLSDYLLSTKDDLSKLSVACNNSDTEEFLTILHRIKGSSRMVGANDITDCIINWESSPRLQWCLHSALRQLKIVFDKYEDGVNRWRDKYVSSAL
ncbi:ATP-binding protein [Aeromonas veronii]|uniref:ATP-binding protein n=1 Tax=Aeromonas veronii TaxID=654 RepID=UPI003BA1EA07